MDKRLKDAIEAQINEEFYSSYLYLAMASWADNQGWKGFAHWFGVQEQEERAHALLLHKQLLERGEHSLLRAIVEPPSTWKSVLNVMEETLAHEIFISTRINNLASIAMETQDHMFYQFIQALLKEQIEEESTASDLVTRIRRMEGQPAMLEYMDKELSTRVFVDTFAGQY